MESLVLSQNRKKFKTGFTLIELLVVISIIALLMAILVPALSRAKDIAMCVVCLSNEKQMALANFSYANDHGRLSNHFTVAGHAPPGVGSDTWVTERLEPYGPVQPDQDVRNPRGLWICPADKAAKDYPATYVRNDWWHTYYSHKHGKNLYLSYAYNFAPGGTHSAYLSGYGITPNNGVPVSRKIEEIKRSSATLYKFSSAVSGG